MMIKSKVDFAGVPMGTQGEAEKDGKMWKVTWHFPGREGKRHIVDWFTPEEFKRYLVEF